MAATAKAFARAAKSFCTACKAFASIAKDFPCRAKDLLRIAKDFPGMCKGFFFRAKVFGGAGKSLCGPYKDFAYLENLLRKPCSRFKTIASTFEFREKL